MIITDATLLIYPTVLGRRVSPQRNTFFLLGRGALI
jgi:hypothetical protein